jgi:hypothetical protein
VHLVGLTIEIYYDARYYKRQRLFTVHIIAALMRVLRKTERII